MADERKLKQILLNKQLKWEAAALWIFTFSSLLAGMARWSRLRTSWTFLPFILVSTRLARSRSQAWKHERPWATTSRTRQRASLKFAASHLIFNLNDSLLGQSAGLNHRDSVSGEIGKDFLRGTNSQTLTCSPGAHHKRDNKRHISGVYCLDVTKNKQEVHPGSFLPSFIWSLWEVLQRLNPNCKSPTWSSSDSSLIFFTSHLLATTMRGCRERDTSVTTITCTQTYYTVKPNCRQTCWFCRIFQVILNIMDSRASSNLPHIHWNISTISDKEQFAVSWHHHHMMSNAVCATLTDPDSGLTLLANSGRMLLKSSSCSGRVWPHCSDTSMT